MTDPFPTTSWSLILQAQGRPSKGAREALGRLCGAYWFPLYVYVRRLGNAPDDARDLVQGFFADFLERQLVGVVRPEYGRFRAFLLHKMKHHLANEHQRKRTQKRGGNARHLPLDLSDAEVRYGAALADRDTPDVQFERSWARTLVDRVIDRLAGDAGRRGKQDEFHLLRGYLTEGTREMSYREAAERLRTTEAAVKASVHRMRRRFGQLLREEIAGTVSQPGDVDAEIRYLFGVLG